MDSADVEISEDMFIITPEEAEIHKEPPELAKLLISPSQVQIKPGIKQTFTANGLDQFGRVFDIKDIKWSSTGGEIDSDGVFEAGNDEGNFNVTAKVKKISGIASVEIRDETVTTTTPKPPGKQKLTWSGEVTPQKWMNFYTKVLSRFVTGSGLKLRIEVEVQPPEGVPQQKVDQTKTALRELGLEENLETKK